ncbi:MAG: nickel pincer cofactor biosynthesis protein LarB [Magnetococcales bacterium]|nr:nickel pincer cofactor biosynthesis protein LarB [Magnetococcales bacterium]MBF0321365.1 nickel pincer cofactor biosynthesis protein LarB [Magnetococcales bacterium]
MSPERLKSLLTSLAEGRSTVEDTMGKLARFPVDLLTQEEGIVARLDTHRGLRHGFPEVIFAQGKQWPHLLVIVERALEHGSDLLITRLSRQQMGRLRQKFPVLEHAMGTNCLYRRQGSVAETGLVGVFCAGTSDIAVAEEAALVARLMGGRVETCHDVGVAGLHRLLAAGELLRTARVFVVVAGMEGALPSVVGGLVDKPVIAVPTSVGYGASLHGLSALLGMLNSCAANVTVVNIDNGFGAGYVAGLINRRGA